MPLFGGFKANFRLLSMKKREEKGNIGEPICGAYRINREEFLTNNVDPTKRNTTPVVRMTYTSNLKPSKSSNDIINDTSPNINNSVPTRQSMPDISQPKPVPRVKRNEREQKKLEKQAAGQRKKEIAEQKKREKQALQEQQRQEKIKKDREKQALQEQQRQEKIKKDREKQEKIDKTKAEKNISKKRAAPPPVAESTPRIPQRPPRAPVNYSTNTLESSISRSSGPPPYSAEPDTVINRNDNTGNTSFSQPPEDQGSWDIISQHREQLNRPKATAGYSKQTHMDLNYNVELRNKDNSDA